MQEASCVQVRMQQDSNRMTSALWTGERRLTRCLELVLISLLLELDAALADLCLMVLAPLPQTLALCQEWLPTGQSMLGTTAQPTSLDADVALLTTVLCSASLQTVQGQASVATQEHKINRGIHAVSIAD